MYLFYNYRQLGVKVTDRCRGICQRTWMRMPEHLTLRFIKEMKLCGGGALILLTVGLSVHLFCRKKQNDGETSMGGMYTWMFCLPDVCTCPKIHQNRMAFWTPVSIRKQESGSTDSGVTCVFSEVNVLSISLHVSWAFTSFYVTFFSLAFGSVEKPI